MLSAHTCVCLCVEAERQLCHLWKCSPLSRQGLSLAWSSSFRVGDLSRGSRGCFCPHLPTPGTAVCDMMPGNLTCVGTSNSGPHTCKAGTLPTELSSHALPPMSE